MAKEESIPGKVVHDYTIPAREHYSLIVKKGQVLRFIDVDGQQVPDVMVINNNDWDERLSCCHTQVLNRTWLITKGHAIYSDRCNKMFTIIEDKVGIHTFISGSCNDDLNYARYGVRGTRNCRDNFLMAMAPYGLTRKDLHEGAIFCLFMNVPYQPDGKLEIREPISKPGDYIDLLAEMDCLVFISNCPQERNPCNAFNPTRTRVVVYER